MRTVQKLKTTKTKTEIKEEKRMEKCRHLNCSVRLNIIRPNLASLPEFINPHHGALQGIMQSKCVFL